jgi:hypothetical protein
LDDKRGHQRGVASARERKGRGGDVKERGRAAAWVNLGRAEIGRAHWQESVRAAAASVNSHENYNAM